MALMTEAPAKSRLDVDRVIDALFSSADRAFLSSAISREEGEFLRALASRKDVRTTIEVGCANGISTLYICSGIGGKEGARHTAIDPFQSSSFGGRGTENVLRAGFGFFRLIEKPSEIALPELLTAGERYDLAFIDGLHTADQTMVDFYYLDRLLHVGGVLVFDDVQGHSVNKIVRYASTYPNYRMLGAVGRRGPYRRIINLAKQTLAALLWPARKALGAALVGEFFDVSVVQAEALWSIDSHTMVALEKTGEYQRDTNWYRGI